MPEKAYIWRVIILFTLGWALLYADRTVLYPLLGVIETEFDLTGAQTGLITSTYFALYVAMQIPAGLLGDRFGLKPVLVATYALAGLALLALGLVPPTYGGLLLLVGLHGLGAGAYYPAAYGITLQEIPRERRGLSAAIVNSGQSLGLALGLALSGPIYLWLESWRLPFVVLAIPTALLALVFLALLRDTPPALPGQLPWGRILSNRNLLAINAANFCSLYGFWVAVTWGATFFQEERGLGLEEAGLYTAVIALAALPAGLLTGWFSDRLGRKRLALFLFPLAAITVFLLGFIHSLPVLLAALVAYGLVGKFAWDPIAIAWTGDHASHSPETMGAAVGIFNFSGMFSAVVAPLVSGVIRDVTGSLEGAFTLGAAVVLAGTVFVALIQETRAPRERR